MGMDVIGVFQVRDKDGWTFLKKYYDGQRGLLRHWLGYSGYYYGDYQVKPLVEHTRGLPDDFEQSANTVVSGYEHMGLTTIDCIGGLYRSWLDVDEILRALPVLGRRTFTVPLSIVRDLMAQNASPEQWESVCKEMEWSGPPPAPRLIEVSPRDVNVDCVFDFTDHEIREFTDEIAELRRSHDCVRFVYGFN